MSVAVPPLLHSLSRFAQEQLYRYRYCDKQDTWLLHTVILNDWRLLSLCGASVRT